jgi:[protein-PII] uridylyltransferase
MASSHARAMDHDLTVRLRSGRDALVLDSEQRGADFGAKLSDLVDVCLADVLERSGDAKCAIVALGSYARRALCPGSDIDVLLVLPAPSRLKKRNDFRPLAERLWYPLWDAGFVTGHGARTVKDSVALATEDLDARTALLEIRHVAGNQTLSADLATTMLKMGRSLRDDTLGDLSSGAELRRHKPGLVAEMLEPNLKDGGGALRDINALGWANCLVGGTRNFDALIAADVITAGDAEVLARNNEYFLQLRVSLHRVTRARSDVMALQDQDAIAELEGVAHADVLMHDVARAGRAVAWIARQAWDGLLPRASPVGCNLPAGLAVYDGRLCIEQVETKPMTLDLVLEAAVAAATHSLAIGSRTLRHMAAMAVPDHWSARDRALFVALLRQGGKAIEVFEALDHVGVLARILPEWERVRSLPQRNAYHHHTVDRHLLEAVSECALLLDAGERQVDDPTLEAVAARACRRPDLLLLAALLHDIGKGLPEDHALIGARIARDVSHRIGLDTEGVEILEWLVRDHLVMADTATRRDLSDAVLIERFCEAFVGDGERLRLLYLLTIGDSIATGPAAWSKSKGALLRDLFVKSAAVVDADTADDVVSHRSRALIELIGDAEATALLRELPESYVLAFEADTMATHHNLLLDSMLAVRYDRTDDNKVVVTIAAPDSTGLLATVAGALTCCGLTVESAMLFTTTNGMALDVFTAVDTFGRYADGAARVRATIESALAGEIDVASGVEERRIHYDRAGTQHSLKMIVDADASLSATVIEVHATDQVGLLFRLAQTFRALNVDVTVAKVATLGDRVVDTFYVTANGSKIEDPRLLESLRDEIAALALP